MEEKILNEMKSLNEKLLEASESYYQKDVEIMTNAEYDALYDKLVEMEEKYNFILPNSITQQVGSEVVSKLVKEKHKEKALSLDKTKDRDVLVSWLGENIGILSWKLDGLTVVATYKKGKLEKAVTRGNGEIGEVITHNAKFFAGLPQKIAYTGELVIRGEALMTYSEFERVNSLIADASAKYKNPRNLASGTIRQLDSSVCKERKINFKAFELVSFSEDILSSKPDTFENRFAFLKDQGFDVVELYESATKVLKEKGFSGIYVIYDEFSKYLEANITDASVSDTKMLQDFAEKCNRSGDTQMHLMLISHKEISGSTDSQAVSTYILPRLSEKVAQNERTLFTFLSANTPATLSAFLAQYGDQQFELITPDWIYDYFEPLLQKELNAGSIHDTFILSARILRQLQPDSLQAKIIKAIALIYMLEQFERLQPTQEEILDIFGSNYSVEEIKDAIDDLIENKYLIYLKRSNGYLQLKQSSGVDICSSYLRSLTFLRPYISAKKRFNFESVSVYSNSLSSLMIIGKSPIVRSPFFSIMAMVFIKVSLSSIFLVLPDS